MKCIQCKHLDLRTSPKMSASGFGQCTQEKLVGVFESILIERNCDTYLEAPAEIIKAREQWWDENRTKLRADLKCSHQPDQTC